MSNQIVISSGAKVRNLNGVLTGTSGVVDALGINVPSGIPQLDGSGKILVSQLPNSVMEFKGTWNAATNTPTLVNGTGNAGDVYLCNVAGTVNFGAGPITFAIGDQVLYSGTTWERASGATGTVTSVAVTESGDALSITGSPITTSGTINIGFAGTSGQYVNGAGGLTTFPSLTGFVPYTGATGSVNLGEYQLSAGQVTFDQTPTGAAGVGVMRWNDTDGTLDLGLKGGNVTLQIGQEQVKRVVNGTGINLTEAAYQVVKVSGAQGQRLQVVLAQANNDLNSATTLGIVTENINNNQEGFITTSGEVRGINTTGSLQGETWTDGDILYLSPTTAGKITNIKPVAPNHMVIVGFVEYAHQNNGKIFVKVDNGYELDELHNVNITTPLNNQALIFDSTDSVWKNESLTSALGYTPVPTTRTISTTAPLTGGGHLSANRTLSMPAATTSVSGYLTSTDWNTFNNKEGAVAAGTTAQYYRGDKTFQTLDTLAVAENTNLYYTQARFDTAFSGKSTTNLAEGTNLYFTTARAQAAISGTAPIDVSGGVVSISQASGSSNGYLSNTDWNTFNGKQAALNGTGFVKISGTTISYDNSTYLTTSAASGTYLPLAGGTLTGPLNGTSANFSGKVGINSTIAAWMSAFSVLQIGQLTSVWNSDINHSAIGHNIYYTGTFYKYLTNTFANKFEMGDGVFTWDGAASGTAGNNVIFSEYMRLNESGNLGINTLAAIGSRLQVNGNVAIGFTSSTAAPSNGLVVSGNTLIGTTTDNGYKLNLNGSQSINGNLVFNGLSTASGISFRTDIPDGTNVGIMSADFNGSANDGLRIYAFDGLAINTGGSQKFILASNGSAAFSSSVTSTSLSTGTASGSSVNITTNGNAGTVSSPLPTSINFVGYLGNINGQIKVEEISGSAQVSNMYFYTYFFGQRLVMSLTQTGNVVIQNLVGTGSRTVLADANGQLSAPVSDISVKQNITSIGYGLNEILKMNPVWFDFIDEYKNYGEARQNGNIAQEMKAIIPEAVFTTPSTGKMGINYDQMHAVYIKAIQELKAEIEELKTKIK